MHGNVPRIIRGLPSLDRVLAERTRRVILIRLCRCIDETRFSKLDGHQQEAELG